MCGIAGFCNLCRNFHDEQKKWDSILRMMNHRQKHRGPDDDGIYLSQHCGLAHVRLSILDPKNGSQPMTRDFYGHRAPLCFNGEIYNMPSLKTRLHAEGIRFETNSDTEVLNATESLLLASGMKHCKSFTLSETVWV